MATPETRWAGLGQLRGRDSSLAVDAATLRPAAGSVGSQPAGSACATGVLLLSRAFDHARDFAGTTRIPPRAAETYDITGRCGGGSPGVSATVVGLAAGTLAAPGVWLLYRRLHPTGLGR